MERITIDPSRFLTDLDTLRQIGRVGTGVVRPAYSAADIEARHWLVKRMSAAGLQPTFDAMGNLFGLPPDRESPVLLGSHSDTQPEGGWLDGAFGVIAALEVARASHEGHGPGVAVVSFQEEEGRFGGVVTGSRVWTGAMSQADADNLADADGNRLGDCRKAAEFTAGPAVSPTQFAAFIEPHIEQGPNLIKAGERIGVVEKIVGIRQVTVTLTGEQNHAGTTPMANRRDVLVGLAKFQQDIAARFREFVTDATVWTIGRVQLHPNAPSVVPGQVTFSVQWRDVDATRLDRMEQAIADSLARLAEADGFHYLLTDRREIAPTPMARNLVDCLAAAAERCASGKWRRMISGALHDAASVAAQRPSAMLFVPSIGGISHSFAEDTSRDDLVLGVEVLATAVHILHQ